MHPRPRPFVVIAALAVAVFSALAWQRHTAATLRAGIAGQRAQAAERARLAAQHRQLAATQADTERLETLLAERAAVAQLQAELESIRRRARESATIRAAPPTRPAAESVALTPPLAGHVLSYQLWQNAGQATPDAAFESVLWASAAGDIDALVRLLALDPEARTRADALFAQLPESVRREFASPERLIACLTAKDVPLGSATILNQFAAPTETKVSAQIFDAEGKPKLALFSLRAENDRWQLVVPGRVVQRYTDWLHTPLAPEAAGSTP